MSMGVELFLGLSGFGAGVAAIIAVVRRPFEKKACNATCCKRMVGDGV